MPRWQTYQVNSSPDSTANEKEPSQVNSVKVREMATSSSTASAVVFTRRSASPASSAVSTTGASSTPGRTGMTQRKDLVRGSPGSSPSRDGSPESEESNATAICGWVCACIVGALALTFLLVIYLLPTEGIFPVMVQLYVRPDTPNVRQGYLRVYPGFNLSRYVHTISLDSRDIFDNSQEILQVVEGYPKHHANEPPPKPYLHCWFDIPNRTHPCFFDQGWLGDLCSKDDGYGYDNSSPFLNPCFLIRIEDTGDWAPQPLGSEFVADSWKNEHDPAFLGLGCRLKDGDKSGVTFEHRPTKGFSVHYFPITTFDPEYYLSPAVMVQVKRVPRHANVTIECYIRTHNQNSLTDNGYVLIQFLDRSPFTAKAYEGSAPTTRNVYVQATRHDGTKAVPSISTNATDAPPMVPTSTNSTMISAEPTNSTAVKSTVTEDDAALLPPLVS